MRAAAFMGGAVLLASCVISGTLAKYVTNASGTGTGVAAKWNVQLNGEPMTGTNLTFHLFEGAGLKQNSAVARDKIAPGTQGQLEITIANESEVDANVEMYFTQTTTNGNGSSIPILYSLDNQHWTAAKTTDGEQKISFKYEGADMAALAGADWTTTEDSANAYTTISTKNALNYVNKGAAGDGPAAVDSKSFTLYWKWDYESASTDSTVKDAYDQNDTNIGTAAANAADPANVPNVVLTAHLTAVQAEGVNS